MATFKGVHLNHRQYILFLLIFFALGFSSFPVYSQASKILHLSSYSSELSWTAGINSGIQQVLEKHPEIQLKTFYLDTKRRHSEPEIAASVQAAKQLIEQWQPDLIISSDDNAARYVIVPYYKNSQIPVVFCGINWSAEEYGFPCDNVTGMIEVQLIDRIIKLLKPYAKGNRIGFLKGDDFSARKEAGYFEKTFQLKIDQRFVNNFDQWQEQYLQLQNEADILLLGNAASIHDWDPNAAQIFINDHTRIPSGNWDVQMAPYSLITVATLAEEQGIWAAQTALRILNGEKPLSIPLVRNKEARTILNMMLAEKIGIHFPREFTESARFVSAQKPKVFYVNSYHRGYKWSDEIEKGLLLALKIKETENGTLDDSQSKVALRIFRLNTKLIDDEELRKEAARKAKKAIDEWNPDILLVSDDNTLKYLVIPYFKKSGIPIIFSAINADISEYALPLNRMTGMLEQNPFAETFAVLRKIASGNRIGYVGADNVSNQWSLKSASEYVEFSDGKLVRDFAEWKDEYLRLQDSVDMLLLASPVGIGDWDEKEALDFIYQHTKIPSCTTNEAELIYTLLGRTKVSKEFGWWAGVSALRVLNGEPVTNIPITTNKSTKFYLNMELANRLGIVFPQDILKEASFLGKSEIE